MRISSKKAFTMVELIFVIVVIGILAGVAIPKMAASRDDAVIAKARATVAAARSALSTERQKRILRGEFADINKSAVGDNFTNLLEYDVKSCTATGCGGWQTGGADPKPTYTFYGPTGNVVFELDSNKLVYKSGSGDYE